MDKINKLVLGMIPNQNCNLNCEYCYISQVEAWDEPTSLQYTPEHITKCLSKARLGGVSLINLTGNGETMLQPDIVPLIGALLEEGHYVEVVTNGTITKHIKEVLTFPKKNLSRLFFKISFHYKELKKLKMIERFFENVKAIHAAGASFTLELMAYDSIEEDIVDIKRLCLDNVGAYCHTTIGRNDKRKDKGLLSAHSKEEFRAIWSELDSPMTSLKLDVIGVKRKEFCYAGSWSLFVNMNTGESQPCYWQPYNQNVFKNPNEPIRFISVGHACTQPYCTNAHAHLCWGIIPELNIPHYSDMRNRKMCNGEEWLTPECKEFFNSKLVESNAPYSPGERALHSLVYPFRMCRWFARDWKNNVHRLMNYMKRIGK